MTPKDLTTSLLREEFLRELHHLLWIEPRINAGMLDEGWNCRDHALIVAAIAQMSGFDAAILMGRAGFVQGPRGAIPGVGIGVSPHAWVGIAGAGQFDLSVRLNAAGRHSSWSDWGVAGLFASQFEPSGSVRAVFAQDPDEYDKAYNAATRLDSTNSAIYYCDDHAQLTSRMLSNAPRNCNSLLTGMLEAEFGDRGDLHARAVVHLIERLHGRGTSLTSRPQLEAWRILADRPGDAVWRVCSRGRLS